jgi:hypothetical protein
MENENDQEISVNFVDSDNSWTLIQKKKCKRATDDLNLNWNKQQRENFKRFGDPYYQEPYKYYHEVDISAPVTNLPLQQPVTNLPPNINVPLQQPVANLPLLQPSANLPVQQPLPVQPAILPAPLPASPQPPQPLPIIAPPPPKHAPEVQKRILQAIPEEDKQAEPERQRLEAAQLPPPLALSPAKLHQLAGKLERPAGGDLQPEVDQRLQDALEHLAISPDQGGQPGLLPNPANTPRKGMPPEPGTY